MILKKHKFVYKFGLSGIIKNIKEAIFYFVIKESIGNLGVLVSNIPKDSQSCCNVIEFIAFGIIILKYGNWFYAFHHSVKLGSKHLGYHRWKLSVIYKQ